MDKDTAVKLCRKYADLALSISNREFYSEIADFIEQQAVHIVVLRKALEDLLPVAEADCYLGDGNEIIQAEKALSDTQAVIDELIKYAELGRLVAECKHGICHPLHYNEGWSACRQCCGFKSCQKRAELRKLEGCE